MRIPALQTLSTLLLALTVPAVGFAQPLTGYWGAEVSGKNYQDSYNQKSASEFNVNLNLTYQAVEYVSFNLVPKFSYVSGYSQTLGADDTNSNQWKVKNASVDLNIEDHLLVSAGALNQQTPHHKLLFHDRAFPGLSVKAQTKGIFRVGIQGETAIATSNSLTTQTRDFEKTPTFQSAGIFAEIQSQSFAGTVKLASFQFENLPMSVATPSGLLGNTTIATTGTDSVFKYEYKGYMAAINGKWQTTRNLALFAEAGAAKNSEAPDEMNTATESTVGLDIRIKGNWLLTPTYQYFNIQPDAVVATYNHEELNTNRVGYQGALALTYKDKIRVKLAAGERDVLFVSPTQQREKTFAISLETLNVAI